MEKKKSNNETNSARLSFNTRNDALSYANKLVQDGINWLAVHNRNLCDSYKEGKVEIVLEGLTAWNVKYYLVIRANSLVRIPGKAHTATTHAPFGGSHASHIDITDANSAESNDHGGDDFVFVGITKF